MVRTSGEGPEPRDGAIQSMRAMILNQVGGAGEKARQSRALAALGVDLGSVLVTHQAAGSQPPVTPGI